MATVPPTAVLTSVTVRVCVLSFAGPFESLPVRLANGMTYLPAVHPAAQSSEMPANESPVATGGSLTSTTVKLAVPTALFGSGEPLLVPLSVTVYWKLAAPLKSAVGVNSTFVPLIATEPPTAPPTPVIVMVCPFSSAGPALSLASSVANGITYVPAVQPAAQSSSILPIVSPVTLGGSLASVTET